MSTEENGPAPSRQQYEGGWQPIPQGEYDADATAFVQLPPDGALDTPLAAPGHGYVPPQFTPHAQPAPAAGTDPAAAGSWMVPPQHEPMPEPAGQHDQDPHATGRWSFPETEAAADGPSELTGQWTIPVAQGDLPDESGEFTTSALASQWGGGAPPATLPGGASAPWATAPETPEPPAEPAAPPVYPATLPGGASAPWATVPETPEPPAEPAGAGAPEPAAVPEAVVPEQAPGPGTAEGEAEAAGSAEPAEPDAPTADAPTARAVNDEHPHTSYVLRVNGADRPVTDAWVGESLLYVLRERLGLAGAKDGCSQGECGACNVQVDGRLVASCLVPAATAAGSEVRTVEGLATDGEPSDVQRALAKCGAVQCGYCIPGMAMTVHDLLEGNHAPTELETRQALCGNLCRCSGYRGVLEAVREVVTEREASAAAAAAAVADSDDEQTAEQARIPHQAPPGAGSVQPHPHDGGMA
ncbi:2Fe-2S iron-sulfur cluster-binding protein [Streptomyces formicae]|uniref:(2Fe-2S)-binding protein n=1 Tax=Streptomyces formicae TaxID=1616117 RepID=A0ABY3WRZ7_9ACTN|nr:(2Fe-2S)-binding protein [Streptomyces formicae]UNM15418.1 (2Fe-2S)-binding protein [Streptomyces formicae]